MTVLRKTGLVTANRVMAIILIAMVTCPNAVALSGAEVFEQKCKVCHTAGPASYQSNTQQIAAILTEESNQYHHFKLTENEVSLVLEYISQQKTD